MDRIIFSFLPFIPSLLLITFQSPLRSPHPAKSSELNYPVSKEPVMWQNLWAGMWQNLWAARIEDGYPNEIDVTKKIGYVEKALDSQAIHRREIQRITFIK